MKKIVFTIMIIVIIGVLQASIIYVPDNYPTIAAAVNASNDNDEIIVRDGNYTFSVNEIELNKINLILRSENCPELCIFDFSQSSCRFEIFSSFIKIDGFSFINSTDPYSGTLIYNYGFETTITNCIFENNNFSHQFMGSTISSKTPFAELSNCRFINNTGDSIINIRADYILGSNPIVNEIISNNLFINNTITAYYDGADLKIQNSSWHYLGELTNNTFADNSNNAIYFQPHSGTCESGELSIKNCIFSNTEIVNTNHISFSYSNFNNSGYQSSSNWGIGNLINSDPLFVDIANDDCSLKWNSISKSPCIDAGDSNILNNDGNPSDIGAITAIDHNYHTTIATSGRYRWISFPVIDRLYSTYGYNTTYICQPIESQTDYFRIFDENKDDIIFSNNSWDNGVLNIINSKIGYKIQTNDDVDILTYGFSLAENSLLNLHAGQNWVGYFVKESLPIDVAFADIWDNIQSIYGEDWAWKKGDTIPSSRCGLIYGKMYIVNVDTACNFRYNHDGIPVDTKEREMTEGFSYTETPDYSPINISNITDPEISEIGILLDGECIGASKVNNELVQILAFPPSDYDGTGEITFQLYNGNRSYKEIKDYQILGKRNEQFIELLPYKFNNIRFGKTEKVPLIDNIGNYPNPFNPTTTIQFNLVECSSENTKVEIFNIRGQKVKTLINDKLEIGKHTVTWNGKDSNNKVVTSGVYFYKISTSDFIVSKKMIMLK